MIESSAKRTRERQFGGCALSGIIDERGERFSGDRIIKSISTMRDRTNGLGGGFSGYGIYPDRSDSYAFHVLIDEAERREKVEEYLKKKYEILEDEEVPHGKKANSVSSPPLLRRYFLDPIGDFEDQMAESDFVKDTVMKINTEIDGSFVISSGKNMGVFKGVGYPEDIGKYFKLDEYEGYMWIAHGRFPTNSTGWWGGAHPFGLLDWSIAHNGEISSYGINRRFLKDYGYHCTLSTDSEAIAYIFDLLGRKHGLDFDILSKIVAAPLWRKIDELEDGHSELLKSLRITYSSSLINGPFSVIVGRQGEMVGLNDRIKLRPLVAGRKNEKLYLSSEESGIREICPQPDRVWFPEAGEPVIGRVK
ncbi:MAG: class II glutamine amidotransferase [Candidatus Hadarchaeota archaeon]